MEIAWKPNPGRQTFALQRPEFEILYGGARGGGKTDAGIAWLTRWIHHPKFRGLVLRRNAEDLKDWVDRASQLYAHLGGVATGKPTIFTFPSGAIIYTGHIKDQNAYTKYQGQQFQKIVWEELNHTPTEDSYEKVIQSCRSTIPELKPQIFANTNPGEVGHEWVKRRFIDVQEPMKPYYYEIEGITLDRIFIPATVDDNPVLMESDPTYIARLNSIKDDATRMRWRYGSWDSYEIKGAYFSAQYNQAEREGRIGDYQYNPNYEVMTFWDIGVGDATAIWFAQRVKDKIFVIDYFETNGEGMPFYVDIIKQKPYRYSAHFFPHDMQNREFGTGRSRLETAYELGIKASLVPNLSIDDGIQAAREVFAECYFNAEKCATGLNALKNYRKKWDDQKQVYSNEAIHDWTSHGSDAFRYMAVSIRKYVQPLAQPSTEKILEYRKENEAKMMMESAFHKDQPQQSNLQPYEQTEFF